MFEDRPTHPSHSERWARETRVGVFSVNSINFDVPVGKKFLLILLIFFFEE
jgi:hypothetical protein